MPEPTNPLIPAAFDMVWAGTTAVVLVLLVVALVSIARVARSLTPTQSLGWTLLAILFPVVGPLAWLCIGRRSSAAMRLPE